MLGSRTVRGKEGSRGFSVERTYGVLFSVSFPETVCVLFQITLQRSTFLSREQRVLRWSPLLRWAWVLTQGGLNCALARATVCVHVERAAAAFVVLAHSRAPGWGRESVQDLLFAWSVCEPYPKRRKPTGTTGAVLLTCAVWFLSHDVHTIEAPRGRGFPRAIGIYSCMQ